MQSLEMTSGDLETTSLFGTWKRELPEVTATAGGCGNCWKLRRVPGEARNMMENALYILIVIFFRRTPTN